MKACMVFVCDSNYLIGLKVLLKSLKKYNDIDKYKKILLTTSDIKENIDNIDEIRAIDKTKYSNMPKKMKTNTFYKLEMFNIRYYDRVVYIDCDILCMGNIDYLFSDELNQYDICACPDHGKNFAKNYKRVRGMYKKFDVAVNTHPSYDVIFNSGVVVINKCLLCDVTFTELMKLTNAGKSYDKGDQGILNEFVYTTPKVKFHYLPFEYNFLKRVVCHPQTKHLYVKLVDKIKLFHFVASKPWSEKVEVRYKQFVDLWKEYL